MPYELEIFTGVMELDSSGFMYFYDNFYKHISKWYGVPMELKDTMFWELVRKIRESKVKEVIIRIQPNG
jgi:hypothetical protein